MGHTLLEPHINYTNHVFALLDAGIDVKGIAHITGGGLVENIPRILPDGVGIEIQKESWPVLSVFKLMKKLGKIDCNEMLRTFNMGIGIVFIVDPHNVDTVENALEDLTTVYEIGSVVSGKKEVRFK